jgi:hypothetical protein
VREEAGLSLIVVWKGVKAALALVLAARLSLAPRGLLGLITEKIASWLQRAPEQLAPYEALALVGLAALYCVQGAGLHYRRRWAAWLTVIPTASLIPVELWAIIEHPHLLGIAALVINLCALVYLAVQLRRHHFDGKAAGIKREN